MPESGELFTRREYASLEVSQLRSGLCLSLGFAIAGRAPWGWPCYRVSDQGVS